MKPTPRRSWVYYVLAALAAMGLLAAMLMKRHRTWFEPPVAEPEPGPPRLSGEPPHPPPPSDPADAALLPVQALMDQWRRAILERNPDEVLAADAAFLDDPKRYRDALVESARSDSSDQVRAFSTRVLGKFRDRSLTPVFRALLKDRHQYVRENAAWALEQLKQAPVTP